MLTHLQPYLIYMFYFSIQDGFLERLSSTEFVALSREVEKFVGDCETVCGKRSISLRGSLQSQVLAMLFSSFSEKFLILSFLIEIQVPLANCVSKSDCTGYQLTSVPHSKILSMSKLTELSDILHVDQMI